MAEKTLNTRIINKHADLSVWNTSSLTLKAGEIALARVETTKPDGHGGFYKVPTYLMKVGDGDKTFSQLEWLAAPASDVYAWAKKEHMAASDMPVFTAEDAARIAPTFADAIAKLQSAVGAGGSVAESIQLAIEALDVTDTEVGNAETAYQVVTAVSETDGKISVTRRALGIKDIEGLQAALNAKLDVATYTADKAVSDKAIADNTAAITAEAEARAAAVEGLQGQIDTTNGNVATAQAAAEAAQGAADDAQATADDALAQAGANAAAITAEAEARAAADEGLQGQIDDVKATADAAAVQETVDAKFVEVDAAVEAAQADAAAAQGTADDALAQAGENAAAIAAETEARDAAISDLQGQIDTTNGNVTTAQDAADAAQETADIALGMIGNGYDSENTIVKDIAGVKASVTAEGEARVAADEALDSRVQVLEGKIVDLSGAMHFKGVKTEIPTDYTGYVNGDVIIVGNKEYVYDSESEAKFVEFGDVDDVTSRVSTLEGQVNTLNTNSATKAELEAAVEELEGAIELKADQTALDETNGNVATAQAAAEAAQAAADAAQGTADDALAAADAAQGTADDNAAAITAETEAREAAIIDLQGQIELKADQTALDETNGNVATAQAAAEAAQGAADAAQETADIALGMIGNGYDSENTIVKDIAGVKASVTAEGEAREAAVGEINAAIAKKADQTALDATNAAVGTAQAAAEAAQGTADEALGKANTNAAAITAEGEARAAAVGEINAAIAKKADQTALDTTNGNVATAQAAADAANNKIGEGYDATNTVAKDIAAVKADVAAIKEDYLTAADTYIFDCGGAV